MINKVLIIIFLGFLAVIGLYVTRGYFARPTHLSESPQELQKQSREEASVTVEATPVMFSSAGVDFTVALTTHSVDLDFNLLEKAELQGDKDQTLNPISWDGGRGGHHLSGSLKFPSFNEKTSSMKLIIKNVAGVSQRVFEWKI